MKGVLRSFNQITKEPVYCCQWLAVTNRRNEEGSTWKPGEGDRVCSDHFIHCKKSNIPTSADYVPAIPVNSVCARFEPAQRQFKQQHE